MTDRKRMDHQTFILDFTNDAKIAYAVSPQPGEFGLQRFAKMTRIASAFKAGFQPVKNARRCWTIQFTELFLRKRRDFNLPGQVLS